MHRCCKLMRHLYYAIQYFGKLTCVELSPIYYSIMVYNYRLAYSTYREFVDLHKQ